MSWDVAPIKVVSHQAGLILIRISSQRIAARNARNPAVAATLHRGNEKKSPKHAAMPSQEMIGHARRCFFCSFNAAKLVAAYQMSVPALATGINWRSGTR